jgi:hypothetical protein
VRLFQVLGMCFIRKGMDCIFSQYELKWLDDIMPGGKPAKDDSAKGEDDSSLEVYSY